MRGFMALAISVINVKAWRRISVAASKLAWRMSA